MRKDVMDRLKKVEVEVNKANDFKDITDITDRWGYVEVIIVLKSLEDELNQVLAASSKYKKNNKVFKNIYTYFADRLVERQRKFMK